MKTLIPNIKIGALISRGPTKDQKDIGIIINYTIEKSPGEQREYVLYKIKLFSDAYRRGKVGMHLPRHHLVYVDEESILKFWSFHNEK